MRISVIIPTYQRRDQVVAAVRALERQTFTDFEVLVVVDGSTDGTGPALRGLTTPFPLRVLEQPNGGAAAARSAGGFAARGDILLFMDDDMEADPDLLAEHDRSHREGAAVVVGHIPLHPDSPRGLPSTWVKRWVDRRARRLSAPGATVRVSDLVGGQISVTREAFLAAGGFDARLGCGEDVDFGYRVVRQGYRAIFNPKAISWQKYTVRPSQLLRQWRESGRSSVKAARKHPEIAPRFLDRPMNRRVFRLLACLGGFTAPLRWAAIRLVEHGCQDRLTVRLFSWAQALEFCRGLREAGGLPCPRPVRVLAYHAIEDVRDSSRFRPYGVPPEEFRGQIAQLQRAGYHFISADEFVHYLQGSGGLPRHPVLLTFDDCFASVVEHALPVLEAYKVPAVAFAVTRRLGGTSDWSRSPDAPRLPLLDIEGLRRLVRAGVEIGSHSRTHPSLPRLSVPDLAEEVDGANRDLCATGLGRARLFAYPYGESDERVQRAVQMAGYQAAFTVHAGLARSGQDQYNLPRVEILRGDTGWRLRWKVAVGGSARILGRRMTAPVMTRILRGVRASSTQSGSPSARHRGDRSAAREPRRPSLPMFGAAASVDRAVVGSRRREAAGLPRQAANQE